MKIFFKIDIFLFQTVKSYNAYVFSGKEGVHS